MNQFNDDNFLLQTETARKLYHDHAAKMPIIDFHCHLDPKMIKENHQFKSITELWLGGDHYKWRSMRWNGIPERYCTGDASDWEKFEKWAETVPYTMRNPLYHWTHLELRTCFGINKLLKPETAREIFDECNEKLKQPEFFAQGLMKRYNVEVVCTTDDPADNLANHEYIAEHPFGVKVLPAWRPDRKNRISANMLRNWKPRRICRYPVSPTISTCWQNGISFLLITVAAWLTMEWKNSMQKTIQMEKSVRYSTRRWWVRLFQGKNSENSNLLCWLYSEK